MACIHELGRTYTGDGVPIMPAFYLPFVNLGISMFVKLTITLAGKV